VENTTFGTTSGGNRQNDAFGSSGRDNDDSSRRNEDSYGESGSGGGKVGKLMEKAGAVFGKGGSSKRDGEGRNDEY
jgi:hypothetical protein